MAKRTSLVISGFVLGMLASMYWEPCPAGAGPADRAAGQLAGQPHRHAARPERPVDQEPAHPHRPHHRPGQGRRLDVPAAGRSVARLQVGLEPDAAQVPRTRRRLRRRRQARRPAPARRRHQDDGPQPRQLLRHLPQHALPRRRGRHRPSPRTAATAAIRRTCSAAAWSR